MMHGAYNVKLKSCLAACCLFCHTITSHYMSINSLFLREVLVYDPAKWPSGFHLHYMSNIKPAETVTERVYSSHPYLPFSRDKHLHLSFTYLLTYSMDQSPP